MNYTTVSEKELMSALLKLDKGNDQRKSRTFCKTIYLTNTDFRI